MNVPPRDLRGAQGVDARMPAAGRQQDFVFADPSGRRWRRVRVVLVGLAAIVATLVVTVLVLHSQPTNGPTVTQLTLEEVGTDPPVVGEGPTVRILRIDRSGDTPIGIEPVSGTSVGALTEAELAEAGDAEYVLQRFGYGPTMKRTITLTFDDGPDPVWTPKILDLLSAYGVRATFFDTGENIVAHPDIVQRAVREGHAVAGHSVTHPDFSDASDLIAAFESRMPDRMLRSLTGLSTGYLRMPYIGSNDESLLFVLEGLLRVQNNGYLMTGQDFDPRDWFYTEHPELGPLELPQFDGRNITILLHDAGGSTRAPTLAYLTELIEAARAADYTFTTLPQAQPQVAAVVHEVEPTLADDLAVTMGKATYVWPSTVMKSLFWLAAISIPGLGLWYCFLAMRGRRRRSRTVYPDDHRVTVSAVIAAYNEEVVIGRTIESLLGSAYPITEIVVVDDGSQDRTADVVREWSEVDDRVRLISQPNAGKSAALNHGLAEAVGEAVFTLDADTLVTPATVGLLVRHLAGDDEGSLAGVGMVIRVGNRRQNLLTRWQALEYVSQIGLERAAQDHLGAITIVPGACALWRRAAILAAGGFSEDTLAEDCDLTLILQRMGYRVTLDYEAQAYTEAPETVDALLAQRTRWTYGTIQALYKHRDLMLRPSRGWLGMFVLPWQAVQLVVPLFTMPLVWFAMYMMVTRQGIGMLLAFFVLVTLVHMVMAAFSVAYLKERPSMLAMVPVYRLIFDPLRAYLLYVSAFRVLRGVRESWNKLHRTGSLDSTPGDAQTTEPASRPSPLIPV